MRPLALVTVSITSERSETAEEPSSKVSIANSVKPEMATRRLLKSWAMPPASRPTASIFCE